MYQVYFETLGCPKNEVDTEIMMGILNSRGFQLVNNPSSARIIIINTCGFIQPAKEESINTILDLADYKKKGSCKYLIVAGCLSQLYQDELKAELPEVDAFLGTDNFKEIGEIIDRLLGHPPDTGTDFTVDERKKGFNDLHHLYEKRYLKLTGDKRFFSYLKIAEGCNNRCSYCLIPSIRGPLCSRPMEDILNEAKFLAEKGVKELILVAQDTTRYGLDLYGETRLASLLRELVKVEGLEWIRIMYAYPTYLNQEIIELMAGEEKIVNYLDLPLQHSHSGILNKMNRPYTSDDVYQLLASLRSRIPDIVLRTTLIVGFPGEGQEEFNHLKDFIEEIRFDRLGVFTYSREEGTPAYHFPHQVPEEVKEERKRIIMETQQRISLEKNKQLIGSRIPVVVEEIIDSNFRRGRTWQDAPEIDNGVLLKTKARPGEIVNMKVTGADIYDLIGEEIS